MTMRSYALAGFLLALLGALLPGWNYHVTEQYAAAGWLFFALAAGVIASGMVKHVARPLYLAGCAISATALIALSQLTSPVQFVSQFGAWLAIGFAAGLIGSGSAASQTRAGLYFGAGSLAPAVLVAIAIHVGYAAAIPGILALIPAIFGIFFIKAEIPVLPVLVVPRFSKPGAFILAALLVFQSGSEWTLAGWLPLFLTHRLGISPEAALWMLALYWFTLLVGRLASLFLLAHVRHGRILIASGVFSLSGCALLVSTENIFGASVSILLAGAGLAAIYPLLAEKLGSRFDQNHSAGLKNIFSLALSGGLLLPWLAGLLAQKVSLTAIVAIPAMCSIFVTVLLLVLWLESKVTGR